MIDTSKRTTWYDTLVTIFTQCNTPVTNYIHNSLLTFIIDLSNLYTIPTIYIPLWHRVLLINESQWYCYVWQYWLICTILLELSRGKESCILLIVNYIKCTTIHNGHLWVLFYIWKIMWLIGTKYSPLLQLYISTFTIP